MVRATPALGGRHPIPSAAILAFCAEWIDTPEAVALEQGAAGGEPIVARIGTAVEHPELAERPSARSAATLIPAQSGHTMMVGLLRSSRSNRCSEMARWHTGHIAAGVGA